MKKNKSTIIFKNHFKQDLNFFECPLWFPARCNTSNEEYKIDKKIFYWENGQGFKITSIGIMNRTDILIMYYILMKSQENKFTRKISLSKYKILKECHMYNNGYYYEQLYDTIEKLKSVNITFHENFYANKKKGSWEVFGIIDRVKYNDDKKILTIEFNKMFLDIIKQSNFKRIINFQYYKYIKSQLALRLFEFLLKNLSIGTSYNINIQNIPQKIGLIPEKRKDKHGVKSEVFFDSYIINKMKSAVKYLNKFFSNEDKLKQYKIYSGFLIDFYVYTNDSGIKVGVFTKTKDIKLKKEKKEQQKKLNPDSTLSPELQEVSDWMKFHNVSEKGITQIIRSCGKKNILHDFPYIKDVYSCGKKAPGWIVCSFKERYFKDKPEYNDEEFIMEEWQQEMFAT